MEELDTTNGKVTVSVALHWLYSRLWGSLFRDCYGYRLHFVGFVCVFAEEPSRSFADAYRNQRVWNSPPRSSTPRNSPLEVLSYQPSFSTFMINYSNSYTPMIRIRSLMVRQHRITSSLYHCIEDSSSLHSRKRSVVFYKSVACTYYCAIQFFFCDWWRRWMLIR